MADILIVVDMQKDFIDGSLGTREAVGIVENVKNKISMYSKSGKKIFFTRDTHFENYLETFEGKHLPVVHCVKDSEGWQIDRKLTEENVDAQVIDKYTFGETNWASILGNEFESVEICGLCTDICVISNALIIRAFYPDKDIVVDSSCCAGVTPQKHECALEVMRSCQIDVI